MRKLRNATERYLVLGESCGHDSDQLVADRRVRPATTQPARQLKAHDGRIKDSMAALGLLRNTLYD